MLVLSRKHREAVVIGGVGGVAHRLKITVVAINGARVTLGFEAPDDIQVHRWEVWERILSECQAEAPADDCVQPSL